MKRVSINGFGRIGRIALRLLVDDPDIEIVAINDLSDALQLAYLFKYDSAHRTSGANVSYDKDGIYVNNKRIPIFNEKDPNNLPWGSLKIDVVLECTGAFTSKEKAMAHINAGANKVVISAPAKDDCKTIVYNVNDNTIDGTEEVISAASCTTNCLAPVLYVLQKKYKIKKGFMSTVHAMTNDQETLDIPHKKGIASRRGRAASQNIIPTSTGAAKAIGKVIPELDGKLMGSAYRVPVADGSLIDLVLELENNTTVDEINKLFKANSNETIKIINTPIVSSDIIGEPSGAIVDGLLTSVITDNEKQLIKIVAWYDNEVGYTAQMIRLLKKL